MKKMEMIREKKGLLITILLFAAAILLLRAARKIPGFAEWYSQTIYPVLVAVIGGIFGLFPVSVVEVFLYAGVIGLVCILILYRKKPLWVIGCYTMVIAVLLFLYAACCGVNYYRVPFSTYFIQELPKEEIQKETASEECLRELCAWLVERVNEAYEELEHSDGNFTNMPQKGIHAMKRLAESYPVLDGYYPQPKPVMVSEILSIQQCSGVYSPFTIEANYNQDMVAYNIPHTICHEMSHLRGFMREDEANFIGYLACLLSEDADFRYSGYMLGWIYAGNALAKTDPAEHARLHNLLREEIKTEFRENNEFWDQYEGEVAEAQEMVNDAYLKANGQSEGVLTYGRVVDLMLLDYVNRVGAAFEDTGL